MEIKEGSFRAILVTTGRKSGKEHAVDLRAVYYMGMYYFSRRSPNSDWLKNAISNPDVKILYDGQVIAGKASLVKDPQLCETISRLKYSDSRSEENRIVLQVIPSVL